MKREINTTKHDKGEKNETKPYEYDAMVVVTEALDGMQEASKKERKEKEKRKTLHSVLSLRDILYEQTMEHHVSPSSRVEVVNFFNAAGIYR
jgi:hypothetical protein